jgi:hypothetical protein
MELPGKSKMIPIFDPAPLVRDKAVLWEIGSAQPMMQLKELEVDQTRYQEWKAWVRRCQKRRECTEPRSDR